MSLIISLLQQAPELALFATLAVGVWLGRIQVRGFSLGNACAVLIVAVLFGALVTGPAKITYPPIVKSIAFTLFVFCVGFSSGPQFVASLGRRTLNQVALAVVLAVVGLVTTVVVAKGFGFGRGMAAGVAAGALTQSTVLGTAYGALNSSGLSPAAVQQELADAAVALALTYIVGTIGVILFASRIAPWLMRVDLKDEAKKLDDQLAGATRSGNETSLVARTIDARVFRVVHAAGAMVRDIEQIGRERVAVERVRRQGADLDVSPDLVLHAADEIVIAGRRPGLVAAVGRIGPEIDGIELLKPVKAATVDVVMMRKELSGITLREVVAAYGADTHGVFIQAIVRDGRPLPVTMGTQILEGDVLTLAGSDVDLARVTALVGRKVPKSERSDLATLGFGLLVGTLVGLVSVTVGTIPLTLGAGGAVLMAGLACGWYNTRNPLVGAIPAQASRVLWDLGLALFLAVVGLNAGPQALDALTSQGVSVLLGGAIVTFVPQMVAMVFGQYVLGMNPVLLCGALAGAQTQDAAMIAASDAAESSAPVLGFTVPYAVGNVALTMLGPLIVALV